MEERTERLDIWDRLHALLERYDGDFRADVGSAYAWSGALRLTLTDPEGLPSRSITFLAAGGADAEDVALRVLDDADRWLEESGVEPLPPPEWLTEESEG